MTESALFQDLALLMAVGGFVSVVFARLRWPKVIGYIVAGILISHHTWGVSLLADESSVQTISQLGIVFLMFTLGLEFSASSMKAVKNVAFPAAVLDTVVMTWVGYTVGRRWLGWDSLPSLFLGAAICDSSTTLLAKVIDEMKWSRRPFVKYVLGTSVCEDIICVGIIALITGVASGKGMDVGAVGMSLGGLAVFFIATLVFGLIFVPRLLLSVAKRGDDEVLLLTVLGCCFFIAYVAYRLEFSIALGAFLVGILGAGSDVRSRLHRLADPLRSMFAAMFFLSIGMLVDVSACWDNIGVILVLSAVVVAGKLFNCTFGALAAGETPKTAIQMGFGLAQIGEFAYMVALLYLGFCGDPSSPMYQIVVGVSLLTTVLNPLMLRISDPIGDFVLRRCPRRIISALDAYRATMERFRSRGDAGEDRRIIRSGLIELGIIAALACAVAIAASFLNGHDWSSLSVFFEAHKRFIFCIIVNLLSVGMFVPVVTVARRMGAAIGRIAVGSPETKWLQAVDGVIRLAVLVAAVMAFFIEIGMLNINLAPDAAWERWVLRGMFFSALIFGWRFFLNAGRRASMRLGEALSSGGSADAEEVRAFTIPSGAVRRVTIADGSPAVGGSVVTLDIRARTGASVVSVEREGEFVANPGPGWTFMAGDVIGVMGGDEEFAALRNLIGGGE